MLKVIDWKADDPVRYTAKGEDLGRWVQWEAVVDRTDGELNFTKWRYTLTMTSEDEEVRVQGYRGTQGECRQAVWEALERVMYGFCVESPEDWPHALSTLLQTADQLHASNPATHAAGRANHTSVTGFARRVLQTVPKTRG